MGYNGRLLAKARARLAEIREENAAEQRRRLDEACAKLPGLRELDRGLRRQMIELSRLAMRPGAGSELEKLRAENLELQKKRAELLVSGGFPIDYTDEIYSCRLCRDSGLRGGEPCSCLKKLYNRQLTQELSSLLRGGDESFENFDLDWYDTAADPIAGASPRDCMAIVSGTCREYAKNFGPGSPNLMFMGGTGLGKTWRLRDPALLPRECRGRAGRRQGQGLPRLRPHDPRRPRHRDGHLLFRLGALPAHKHQALRKPQHHRQHELQL